MHLFGQFDVQQEKLPVGGLFIPHYLPLTMCVIMRALRLELVNDVKTCPKFYAFHSRVCDLVLLNQPHQVSFSEELDRKTCSGCNVHIFYG